MKRIHWIVMIVVLMPALVFGQLKKQNAPVDIRSGLLQSDNGKYLGLIDLSKIHMSHSYSLSYQSMGDMAVSQSLYLNTISYQLSDPLSLKMQWGIQSFPYSTFSPDHPAFQSGFVFSGMQLKYQPSDKFSVKFEYSALPNSSYYYPGSYRNFRGSTLWDADE
ncbi:hypothetical protein JW960_23700 [candidate division KSB1 bacterium]|nr:hypothetical protein [candidate division KSB1 bacterium]